MCKPSFSRDLQATLRVTLNRQTADARIEINRAAKVDKAPKTEAGIRDLELNQDAIAALTLQLPATFCKHEHVFLNPRTGQAWDTDAQIRRTLWQPLLKRAGVRHRNPYQVRHSFASSLLVQGENPWYVAQQLGHVDILMFFQIYGKFIREDYQRPKAQAKNRAI